MGFNRNNEEFGLITYLRHAVNPELDTFAAPSFLRPLYRAVRVAAGAMSVLMIATLIVARELIGSTLLIFGVVVTPIAYVVIILMTRLVIEIAIAIFIINDNVMMIRLSAESCPPHDESMQYRPGVN